MVQNDTFAPTVLMQGEMELVCKKWRGGSGLASETSSIYVSVHAKTRLRA